MPKRNHINEEQGAEIEEIRNKNKDKNIEKCLEALVMHAQTSKDCQRNSRRRQETASVHSPGLKTRELTARQRKNFVRPASGTAFHH